MLRKILVGIILVVLVLAAIGLAAGFILSRASFPRERGEVQLSGLIAPADIYRDSFGIPHVYAQNPHDLFFAQGYIHAQDRFYQMDFWRHIGAGRLAEMFGEGMLGNDQFLRTLGWAQVVDQEWDMASPEAKSIMEAYSDGVNAYLEDHRGRNLSLEYVVLQLINPDYQPEDWAPTDTLIFAKVMTWNLGQNLSEIVQRSQLLSAITLEELDELVPEYPPDHPVIVNKPHLTAQTVSAAKEGLWAALLASAMEEIDTSLKSLEGLFGEAGPHIGSNSWVVSGDLTVTGLPLLANDPHLSAQMPSIWYEISLHCAPKTSDCPYDVAGFSFAAAPGIVIGHNDRIAWGLTNLGPDVSDVYIEKVNPDNPVQYEVNGEWIDMELHSEVFGVAGGEPQELVVRSTRHGPIITEVFGLEDFAEESGVELPEDFALAFQWTGLLPGSTIEAILGFNAAQDWDAFRQSAEKFSAPSQNLLFADLDGNIGYQTPGLIPIRNPGHTAELPVPGWTDDFEWQGFIPFEDLPFAFNPPEGYIATANNAIVGPEYPYLLSVVFDYGYRAERIVNLIENAPGSIDLEYMKQIQRDELDLNAKTQIPILMKIPLEASLADKRTMLNDWDHQNEMESAAAALFQVFWKNLLAETFHDDLPEDHWPGGGSRWYEVMRNITLDPASHWWDDQTTIQVETRDEIFARAFEAAVVEIEGTLGPNPERWAWGDLHTLTLENQSLGISGRSFIEAIFNRGPYRTSGGPSIINATGWTASSDNYEVVSLPSMRMIVDLSDLSNSLAIHPTGQSGHAYHRHYVDMVDLWREHQYHPMLWDETDIMEDSEHRLRLVPDLP
jgi:penicillin amidase